MLRHTPHPSLTLHSSLDLFAVGIRSECNAAALPTHVQQTRHDAFNAAQQVCFLHMQGRLLSFDQTRQLSRMHVSICQKVSRKYESIINH